MITPPLISSRHRRFLYVLAGSTAALVGLGAVAGGLLRPEDDRPSTLAIAIAICFSQYIGVPFLVLNAASEKHPSTNPAYNHWLKHSPWTPDKPLPFGPTYLTGFELLSIIFIHVAVPFLTLPSWIAKYAVAISLILAAFAYALNAIFPYKQSPPTWHSTIASLLLPLIFLCLPTQIWSEDHDLWIEEFLYIALPLGALLASIVAVIAHLGLRALVRSIFSPDSGPQNQSAKAHNFAHPLNPLNPHLPTNFFVRRILLMAWWLLIITHVLDSRGFFEPGTVQFTCKTLLTLTATFAAMTRFFRYGGSNPLPILTRIRLRRFLFPPYDIIFLGPVLTILAGTLLLPSLLLLHIPLPIATALSFIATMLIIRFTPPSHRTWHLTGAYSLQPAKYLSLYPQSSFHKP